MTFQKTPLEQLIIDGIVVPCLKEVGKQHQITALSGTLYATYKGGHLWELIYTRPNSVSRTSWDILLEAWPVDMPDSAFRADHDWTTGVTTTRFEGILPAYEG